MRAGTRRAIVGPASGQAGGMKCMHRRAVHCMKTQVKTGSGRRRARALLKPELRSFDGSIRSRRDRAIASRPPGMLWAFSFKPVNPRKAERGESSVVKGTGPVKVPHAKRQVIDQGDTHAEASHNLLPGLLPVRQERGEALVGQRVFDEVAQHVWWHSDHVAADQRAFLHVIDAAD